MRSRETKSLGRGHGREETLDERGDLVAILITEDPICHLSQILEGDDFVGINEYDDIFNDLLMKEEIGRPEVKGTKPIGDCFGAPIVESITELRASQCQNMRRSFGKVRGATR